MFKNFKFLLVLTSFFIFSKAVADNTGIALEGTPVEEAFVRVTFNNAEGYLDYYSPERVQGFGELSDPAQSRVAQVMFSAMIKTADLFFALNPTPDEVRAFLQTPYKFSREGVRYGQSGELVMALQRGVAPMVFERVQTVSEWIRIATFTPVSANEFESVAAEIAYRNFDSFLALNPSLNEIKELVSGKLGFNGYFKALKLFCEGLPEGQGLIPERARPIEVAERFVNFILSPSLFHEADPESVVASSGRELLVKVLKSMVERKDVLLRVVVSKETMPALKESCRAAGYELITAKLTSSVVFPVRGPEHVSYEITRLGKIPKMGDRFDRGARRGSETIRVGNATGEVRRGEAPRETRGILDRLGGWFRRSGARK